MKKFRIVSEPSEFQKVKITSSKDAYRVISNFYGDSRDVYESFYILLLNRANNTIGFRLISQGGIAGTVVDSVLIAKYAIDCLANSVILAHNHPSGTLHPSNADIQLTKQIRKGLGLFNISVIDHLILSGDSDNYLSFADDGFL